PPRSTRGGRRRPSSIWAPSRTPPCLPPDEPSRVSTATAPGAIDAHRGDVHRAAAGAEVEPQEAGAGAERTTGPGPVGLRMAIDAHRKRPRPADSRRGRLVAPRREEPREGPDEGPHVLARPDHAVGARRARRLRYEVARL